MKKYFVVTEIGFNKETNQKTNTGEEIDADSFVIEPSGAATFWEEDVQNLKSKIVRAFAPGSWITISGGE